MLMDLLRYCQTVRFGVGARERVHIQPNLNGVIPFRAADIGAMPISVARLDITSFETLSPLLTTRFGHRR